MTRVLLLWVNNHFTDFETDPTMMEFLERFEAELEAAKMQGETILLKRFSPSSLFAGQLRMLNFACTAKARKRTVTLARPSRDDPLQVEHDDDDEKLTNCLFSLTLLEDTRKVLESSFPKWNLGPRWIISSQFSPHTNI